MATFYLDQSILAEGQVLPFIEGQMPFVRTETNVSALAADPNAQSIPGDFPVEDIYTNGYDYLDAQTQEAGFYEVEGGFAPSTSETFTIAGDFAGLGSVIIEGINYVFINHSTTGSTSIESFSVERPATIANPADVGNITQPKLEPTTELIEGTINGGRISLATFDEDYNAIGARNLIEIVRVADTNATNALRSITPVTGPRLNNFGIGLVFGEYALNPLTGNYEFSHVENGSPNTFDDGNGGTVNILGVNATDPDGTDLGITWGQLLDPTDGVGDDLNGAFALIMKVTDHQNFSAFSQMHLVDDGFRRRAGQVTPYVMTGEASDDGIAYFHIANGTTVPIHGFGSFNYGQIYSASQYRQFQEGSTLGHTVLLATDNSTDGEIYMYLAPQVPGNVGGFADTEESLYALELSTVPTAEGQTVLANWIRVDGNPVTNFRDEADADRDGNTTELVPFVSGTSGPINTLNAQALADWSLSNASQFINPTDIAEDPTNPGIFYFVALGTSGFGELYSLTLDTSSVIPTVTNAAEPATIAAQLTFLAQGTAEQSFNNLTVDSNGQVIVQGDSGSIYQYTPGGASPLTEISSVSGTGVVEATGDQFGYLSSQTGTQDELVFTAEYITPTDTPILDSRSLVEAGQSLAFLEGSMPFVATGSGNFPQEGNIYVDGYNTGTTINTVDGGFTASATDTFTLGGDLAGIGAVNIEGTNYVFVNHSSVGSTPIQAFSVERPATVANPSDVGNITQPKLEPTTDVIEGTVNGGHISLLTFDENYNVIGGRNLIEIVRVADTNATNALRSITPVTGPRLNNFGIGLVFGEYALNPETGNYEFSHVENGSPNTYDQSGNIVNILGVNATDPEGNDLGITWGQLLDPTDGVGDDLNGAFALIMEVTDHQNFSAFSQMHLVDDGFRRRAGQVTPYIMTGEASDDGIAYFHIANGTTVPIHGFGSFNYGQIYSASQYRQFQEGSTLGHTVLLATDNSTDGEIYMYLAPQVPGNVGGFADTEESLYALKLSTVPTAEGQTVLANWIRVDGNPVTNFRDVADADGDGNTTELVPFVSGTSGSINTLNSQALADWSLSNASQFINPTDIAEDASSPGTFYFVAEGASGYGELYKLTLDSNGIIPNVTNAAEPAQIASDVTLVLQGTAANSFDSLTVDANGDVVLHGNERSIFRYSVTDQSITTLGDESTIGTGVVKAAGAAEAYLSSSVQDKLVLTYSNAPAFDSDSVEFTVSEDAEEGVVVGSVTATDLTPGDTVTYSITDLDPDEDNNPAFIIDTSTGEITVNDADDLALLDVFNLTVTATDSTGLTDTTEVEITVEPSDAPGETETPGIFQCSDIFKLVASITSFNIDIDVNFGLFFVDGADGNIGGILPDAAGYKAAAAGRALSLLGLVAQANTTNNGGFNFAPGQLKKILGLQSAASLTKARFTDQFFFGFLSVNTVSIGDLFALANGSGILDSLLESISLSTENDGGSVQDDGEGGFTISFGKLSFSITFDADAVDESFGGLVGIDLDNDGDNEEIVDEVIAKCDDAGEYTISGSIFREAAYNNTIGFFFVNVDGAVLDSSGAEVATPDDLTNYKAAIVANLITENSSAVQYQVSNNTTIEFSFSITTVTAAVYVLPVLAVQGDFSTFSDIYYPVIAANSDRVDHMKFQGAGASGNGRFFGFEDLASNVSDNDFDDFIIQVNVQTA